MKHLATLVTLLISASNAMHAQVPRLWGMATGGGVNSKGTIFHVDADGNNFVKVFDFDDLSGWGPEGSLCLAPNGKLYGATAHGGSGNAIAGTLFSFDPNGAGFHKIVDFDITNGGGNWGGGLVLCSDGLLYGAQYMGPGSGGSIFTVDPATDAYTVVHGLDSPTEGGGVTDKLLLAADGWLYGAAYTGGAFNFGTLFRFDPLSHAFETLHDFTGGDGGYSPYGGICEASNGWMYGTTFNGGLNSTGILYKYDPAGNQFMKLADLDTVPASNCWSSMVSAGPDLLIGTMASGGNYAHGFLYSVQPSTDAFTEVFSFNSANGGTQIGNDILGSDGVVYGLCSQGGTNLMGTVYAFNPTTHVMSILHSFDLAADGGGPRGDLTQVGTAVGITEQEDPAGFHVSPNPTDGPVTVVWNDGRAQQARLCITDALGREVRSAIITATHTEVDMPDQPGVYSFTLSTAKQRSTRCIVKR